MRSLYRWYFAIASILVSLHLIISQAFTSVCTFNRGVALGFLSSGSPYPLAILSILALVVVVFAWKILFKERRDEPEYKIIFLTVFAGLSNVLDRLTHSAVCDYIRLPFSLPIVNLNDIILSVNVIFLLLIVFKYGDNGK